MKHTFLVLNFPFLVLLASCSGTTGSDLPPPGHYEGTSTSYDPHGTRVDTETSTNVFYDEEGKKKAIVNKKTTTDPKGLFNKETSETNKMVD